MSITYAKVTGNEIKYLVERIERVVGGEPINHVSLACIMVAILAQHPNITPELLQQTVQGVSEYLVAFLTPVGSIN